VLLTSCTRKTYSHTDSSVPDGTGGERALHARGTIFRDEYIYGTEFGSSAAALTAAELLVIDAAGNVFEASNATELEQVGMHMTAMLGQFFED
jgi:hypothetical protein